MFVAIDWSGRRGPDQRRALWLGAPAGNSVWGALAWTFAFIAVFAPLAILRYRRVSST